LGIPIHRVPGVDLVRSFWDITTDKKRLVYAGRVGTGFDERLLSEIFKKTERDRAKGLPTDIAPPVRERRQAHWVEPKLVAEVRFSNWTGDGMLRHPAFIALRSDKPSAQIVREKPVSPAKIKPPAANKKTKRNGTASPPAPAPAADAGGMWLRA